MSRVLDRHATVAAFPLGGIGTGNVSLGSRGELRDWELANRPDKGHSLPFTFFAIHVRGRDAMPVTRVLESQLPGPHSFEQGYAVPRVAGLPRLRQSRMRGEYPIVRIDFEDDALPVEVALEAFTPLVPLDSDASGIPAAVLRYRVSNPGPGPVSVTVVGSLSNPVGSRPTPIAHSPEFDGHPAIARRDDGLIRGLHLTSDLPRDDPRSGDLSLVTTDGSITSKRQWLVGFWQDGVRAFWNDLSDDGLLDDEEMLSLDTELPPLFAAMAGTDASDDFEAHLPRLRVGSLGIVHEIAPGGARDFEFVLAWSFPNRPDRWLGHLIRNDPRPPGVMRNHYATRFVDSWEAARHLVLHLEPLERQTRAFHRAMHTSSLDPAVIEAVSSTIAALRSTTCFRCEDGTFAAWEGSYDHFAHCEGTCTHVWSYAQTVAHLFPDLERSARRVELLLETDDDGAMQFRSNRVLGGPSWGMWPAVDGQLGTVIRLYRDWRFSGDDAFLGELWPAARRAVDYALRTWDTDGDGVLDARMHNTYDIEFYGSEPLSNVYLLAALRAAAAMAIQVGDREAASRYDAEATRSGAAVDALLYNGEYYQQRLPPGEDVDAHRYQYGSGVLSDQLLGQLAAHVVGLGHLLPVEHVRSAIKAVFDHNFRHDLSDHESTQRTYALNDEAGLLLASWPRGGRPRIPFIYSDEVWTGVEYQVAAHLAYEGFVDEALIVVRAVRARHDGAVRSPWNEPECGNHYARSMASWALLLAFSGADYDAGASSLSFDPVEPGPFTGFFSVGSGWGRISIAESGATLDVEGGRLTVRHVTIRGRRLLLPDGGLDLMAGESVRLDSAAQ